MAQCDQKRIFGYKFWSFFFLQTEKCGAGIVADEDIKHGEFVIEYVGEGESILPFTLVISKTLFLVFLLVLEALLGTLVHLSCSYWWQNVWGKAVENERPWWKELLSMWN